MGRFVPASVLRLVSAAGLVASLVLVWSVPAEAAVPVDCNANPSALQPAIDAASSGRTLSVSGTCVGTFVISKNLTLRGIGATLDAQGGGTTLTVSSGHVTVTNTQIVGGTGTTFCPPSGCKAGGGIINSGKLVLKNVSVHDDSAFVNAGGIWNLGTLILDHSSVQGTSNFGAGGILNTGTAILKHAIVGGLSSPGSPGTGGIYNGAILTVTDSVVTGIATAGTGGLDNTGTATIIRSEVSGSSGRLGGGILNDPIGTLTLTNSTVSGNSASVAGGGIWNGGVITVTNSTVSGNTSLGSGGGIHNQNQLIVTSSTVSQNTSSGVGGGIYTGRFLGMTSSTISGNSAGSNGGGIFNDFGEVIAATSTVSGNSATSDGGGIFTRNALTILSTTVSGNSASSGAGIFQDTFGSSRIISSIDAGNSGGDCSGPGAIASDRYNLVGADCAFSSTGDQTVADSASAIGIKPLGNHGGRTQTMPLVPKSPAVDAIPVGAHAGDGTVLCPYSDDQRGVARPQGVACDVGAYELRNSTPPPDSADLVLEKTDGVGSVVVGTSTTYTITVTNGGPSSVPAGVVVSDPIPAGTTGMESEVDCTIVAGTFLCTTSAALAPSASVSYQLTLTVHADYPGTSLANTATISSSPLPDPDASNDSATDTDSVEALTPG